MDECETDYRACARVDADPRWRNMRADCVCNARIGALFLQPTALAATTHAANANCYDRRCNPCSRNAYAADAVSAATNHPTPYTLAYSHNSTKAAAHAATNRAYAHA